MHSMIPVLALALCAGGCGYKGPLSLPAAKPGVTKPGPAMTPEPDPGRPVPSEAAPPPK